MAAIAITRKIKEIIMAQIFFTKVFVLAANLTSDSEFGSVSDLLELFDDLVPIEYSTIKFSVMFFIDLAFVDCSNDYLAANFVSSVGLLLFLFFTGRFYNLIPHCFGGCFFFKY